MFLHLIINSFGTGYGREHRAINSTVLCRQTELFRGSAISSGDVGVGSTVGLTCSLRTHSKTCTCRQIFFDFNCFVLPPRILQSLEEQM